MKKKIFLRVLTTFLAVTVMAAIFFMSAQNASESGGLSQKICYIFGQIFVRGFNGLSAEKQAEFVEKALPAIRKAAHVTEFAVLGAIYFCCFASWGLKGKLLFPVSLLSGALYAVSDEIHQLFVFGRAGTVTDVLIDSAGVLFGCAASALFAYLFNKRKKKRNL